MLVLDGSVSCENAVIGKATAIQAVLEPSGERTLWKGDFSHPTFFLFWKRRGVRDRPLRIPSDPKPTATGMSTATQKVTTNTTQSVPKSEFVRHQTNKTNAKTKFFLKKGLCFCSLG
jgi:hypothetical protein